MVLKADAILNVVLVTVLVVLVVVVVVVVGVSLGLTCFLREALEPSAGSIQC